MTKYIPLRGDHDIQYGESRNLIMARILILHVGAVAAFFQPLNWKIALVGILGYFFRMVGLVVGYHRYFAHRTFQASRVTQFILAFLGAAGGFRGPLWWASIHRQHHRYSDRLGDPHSPIVNSRWHAHLGFIFKELHTNLSLIEDYAKYPELRWLNKYHYVAPYLFAFCLFSIGHWTNWLGSDQLGAAAITWGFFLPTAIGIHVVAALNSVTHGIDENTIFNRKVFDTNDSTTNCWALSILNFGESWHNNHHKFPYSARCGIRWWEIDIGYYCIWIMQKVGLAKNVKIVTQENALNLEAPRS